MISRSRVAASALVLGLLGMGVYGFATASFVSAQENTLVTTTPTSTTSVTTDLPQNEGVFPVAQQLPSDPLDEGTQDALQLFQARPATELTAFNGIAYFVQSAVQRGVRPNTVILILLLPFLATAYAFVKHIIGVPSLEMLVPITLAVSLLATGIAAGLALFGIMVFGTFLSRFLLRRLRIMQVPKRALALMIVAVCTFVALLVGVFFGLGELMTGLSIFPILMFLILSDRISTVQLQSSISELFLVGGATILLGIAGYFLLASNMIRAIVLLYPETILLLIPINILIGRYFGLRLTEYFRFAELRAAKE